MRHLNKFNTISEYTIAEPTLSMPNLSLILEDNTVRTIGDDKIVFIEYLSGNLGTYIKTNLIINENNWRNLKIEFEGSFVNTTNNKWRCHGVGYSNPTYYIGLSTDNYLSYGKGASGDTKTTRKLTQTEYTLKHKYIIDYKNSILYFDNESFNMTLSTSPTINQEFYIFTWNANNYNGQNYCEGGKLYNFKIYNNDSLIIDFIPVRIGNVGYMYDTVSKKLFANAGTGNFTLGPDITAVEYLQSDGNQYIDTGIIPNISTGIKISYMKQSTSTDRSEAIFGLQNVQNTSTCWYAISVKGSTSDPTYIRFGRQSYWSVGSHKAPYDVINTISLNYFNNRKSTTSNPSMVFDFSGAGSYNFNYDPMFTALYDIRLFGLNGYKSYQNLIGRIYSCTISQGNKIIMDMIPVRIGTEGYMFDKVSRRFFRNNGTGNFTYGADVAGVDLVNRKEYIKF